MRKYALASIILAAFAAQTSPANATLFAATWVSGTGADTNNQCSDQATPCRSIVMALSNTVSGGTIHVLAGEYAPVLINKAIQIIADEGASIIGVGVPCGPYAAGICVNAGTVDIVRIRGMSIDLLAGSGFAGIMFIGGKALHLEDCTLLGTGAGSAAALHIAPATVAANGATAVSVRNSTISFKNSYVASNPGGNVLIAPTNGVAIAALFDNVHMLAGIYGIRADNSAGSGLIRVDVRSSVAKDNTNNGYLAVGTGANPVHFMIDHSTAEDNGVNGAVATGSQAFMIVSNSTLMGNGTGLSQQSGATIASMGNNTIKFNNGGNNISGTITPLATN